MQDGLELWLRSNAAVARFMGAGPFQTRAAYAIRALAGRAFTRSSVMCEIFIRANAQSYANESRSMRLHGVATSVRLENLFWNVLEEIAQRDGMRVTQLIERLYDELVAYRGQAANFTSFLRVCCLRYERLQAQGLIPADTGIPIASLNPRTVLARLPAKMYAAAP